MKVVDGGSRSDGFVFLVFLYSILCVLSQVARSFDLGIGMWERASLLFNYFFSFYYGGWKKRVFFSGTANMRKGLKIYKRRVERSERGYEDGLVRRGVAWLWYSCFCLFFCSSAVFFVRRGRKFRYISFSRYSPPFVYVRTTEHGGCCLYHDLGGRVFFFLFSYFLPFCNE